MNKAAMFFGVMITFLIPIGVVVSLNFDQLAGQNGEKAKPTGKLVYYYSPS